MLGIARPRLKAEPEDKIDDFVLAVSEAVERHIRVDGEALGVLWSAIESRALKDTKIASLATNARDFVNGLRKLGDSTFANHCVSVATARGHRAYARDRARGGK